MEVKEKSDRHKCSVCLKDADLVCKACKGTPDGAKGITTIYYCSAACQKEDWKAHKPKCRASKDRQNLYRAGGLAQRLWLLFCKKTWQWVIDEVEVIDLGLIKWEDIGRIYFGEYWEVRHGRRTPSMKNYLLPFPIERFPDVGQQEALLTQSRCRDALFIMDDIINDLLQGEQ